jgi:hypothetical protein
VSLPTRTTQVSTAFRTAARGMRRGDWLGRLGTNQRGRNPQPITVFAAGFGARNTEYGIRGRTGGGRRLSAPRVSPA